MPINIWRHRKFSLNAFDKIRLVSLLEHTQDCKFNLVKSHVIMQMYITSRKTERLSSEAGS